MPRAKKTEATKKVARKKGAGDEVVAVVQALAEELLSKLEVPATVKVVLQEEDLYQVSVETEESGLLIGFHGETLSAFQLILGLMVYKKLERWVRVVVEVGDYRERRAEQLTAMANSYAEQVVATGQPMYLPYLPPIERRIVHIALSNHPQVMTESEGEGNQRRIVIKPK